ncbi:glycosyltransferase family 4 protein [Clostridium kluyveri]|uniref:glycosyltransferase family 4 protein n=1 Tax=Clostridium kluyveri TaxID=1534 RepID=UPI002245D19E|nr:glycosyltransferase family 4 protein [Clostridium kluyveri]UZQ50354.1 glycosyltransferase family 4 protein [Clostridium kluyveri]
MMNVKRVLIVHNYYQVSGGEDIVVSNEKKMLEDNGHKVIVYSRNNSEIKKMDKFQKLCLLSTVVFSIKTYREVKKIIKAKDIDIVHVHNTLSLISPSVYYAAISCNVPVIQTIHNFRLLCPGATFYRDGVICEDCVTKGLKCAVKHKCYRGSRVQTLACIVILTAHRLLGIYKKINYICLTDFNKKKLLQLNSDGKNRIDESKVFVKPNFVNTYKRIIPYELRSQQFVFVGRLDKLKGIGLLLEAWKEIKDFDLIICGVGPEENWCRKFIEKNGMTNVNMMGHIPNTQVMDIIAKSKALILPTRWYEGFPMTIVESWGVGTPVIGSNIGNVGNLIKSGINGFKFEFDSVESLQKVIRQKYNVSIDELIKYKLYYSAANNYKQLFMIYNKIQNKVE